MQSNAIPERRDVAAPHPIAELLACPPAVGNMLNASAESIEFDAGDILFHQNDVCRGLYVVISGYLVRKAARLDARLTLGTVRAGEVVELAAMLGDVRHTYTLIGQSKGTAMRLPKEALQRAFELYPTAENAAAGRASSRSIKGIWHAAALRSWQGCGADPRPHCRRKLIRVEQIMLLGRGQSIQKKHRFGDSKYRVVARSGIYSE